MGGKVGYGQGWGDRGSGLWVRLVRVRVRSALIKSWSTLNTTLVESWSMFVKAGYKLSNSAANIFKKLPLPWDSKPFVTELR